MPDLTNHSHGLPRLLIRRFRRFARPGLRPQARRLALYGYQRGDSPIGWPPKAINALFTPRIRWAPQMTGNMPIEGSGNRFLSLRVKCLRDHPQIRQVRAERGNPQIHEPPALSPGPRLGRDTEHTQHPCEISKASPEFRSGRVCHAHRFSLTKKGLRSENGIPSLAVKGPPRRIPALISFRKCEAAGENVKCLGLAPGLLDASTGATQNSSLL